MNKVEQLRSLWMTMAQERIDAMHEMPSENKARIRWYEASKAIIEYLPTASDEWVLKHDKANSTLVDMAEEIKK